MDEKRNRFLEVLLRHLGAVDRVADIPDEKNLRTLGLNSMRAVDLVIDLEEEFGFTFPDELFTDEVFSTADRLWHTVHSLLVPVAEK